MAYEIVFNENTDYGQDLINRYMDENNLKIEGVSQ